MQLGSMLRWWGIGFRISCIGTSSKVLGYKDGFHSLGGYFVGIVDIV